MPADPTVAAPLAIASITVDCRDADTLARFWAQMLGLAEAYASDDRSVVALEGDGMFLSFVSAAGYQPPTWPTGGAGQQLHLDLYANDLDADSARAQELGATLAEVQPNPNGWRVMLDPAGHPFCLMLPFEE